MAILHRRGIRTDFVLDRIGEAEIEPTGDRTMVKRHNPKPPGRRRLAPVAAGSNEQSSAAEMVAVPVELPGEGVTSESHAVQSSNLDSSVPPLPAIDAAPQAAIAVPAEPALEPSLQDVVADPSVTDLQPLPAPSDVPFVVPIEARKLAPYVPAHLVAVGTTLQAFVLNEGLAALAHWRALSRSQSPTDALRLQVDEMQRAADASLTCLGRIAGHLGRIGASRAA